MVRYHNWWKNPDTEKWFTQFFDFTLLNFSEETKINFLNKIELVSVFGDPNIGSKIAADHVKILFIGENVTRQGYERYNNDKALSHTYDLVLGFHEQSKTLKNVFRFPLWLTYIPFYKNLNLPLIHEEECRKASSRTQRAVIVCSHDRTGIRKKCVDGCVSKGFNVDVAGKWFYPGASRVVVGSRNEDKLNLLKCYAINVCPENSLDTGYTTEKLFQSIEAGCLPIYDGCKPVEPNILNQSRVVYIDELQSLSKEHLISKMDESPYTNNARYWIMKYYLEMWAKVWYAGHQKGIRYTFDNPLKSQSPPPNQQLLVHNYFIIPYRNRESHIDTWTKEVSKLYNHAHFKYSVILVEQDNQLAFNKGKLLNVGFWKAMEMHHETYGSLLFPRPNLIFNDVDVLCKDIKYLRPEEYVYHPYGDAHCLGCIFVCSPEAYLTFNGFSNNYNGWGREDVDALLRIKIQKLPVKTDGYQNRRSNKSFVEFHHESNKTVVKANYAEYDALNKNNNLLYESGVSTNGIAEIAINSRTVNEFKNTINITHVYVK